LTNARPIFTEDFSGEHPPGPRLEFPGPEAPNCGWVVRGGSIQAGQQLRRHVGSIFFRQREHFLKKGLSLVGYGYRLQGRPLSAWGRCIGRNLTVAGLAA
jgi:hypothetical protein